MATKVRSKPFDRFGRFILFKKLDTHALGEMWRAGTIEDNGLGPVVALHRLSGGDRNSMREAAEGAGKIVPQITIGTSVKNQTITIVEDTPTIVHEYAGGRTLRHIIERARGSATSHAQPISTEQALSIAEKVASSVEGLNNLKIGGGRLNHGAILPHFIWVTDDGDVRTAGQQLGKGIAASIPRGGPAAAELGPYIAPEIRESGEATKASDIYSLGAILFLCLTNQEPPDPSAGGIDSALSNAVLAQGAEPIPPEIRTILHKSMVLNPAERYGSAGDFRQALSQLLSGGTYAPTTFNLAFYLHTLLRKEMEGEAVESEKESKVSVAPYLAELMPPRETVDSPGATPASFPTPTFGSADEKPKNKTPLIAAALVILLLAGAGIAYVMTRKAAPSAKPAPPVAKATPPPAAVQPPPVSPVVSVLPSTSASTSSSADARKKAIEDEVNRRLQAEVQKLQADYNKTIDPKKPGGAQTTPSATTRPEPTPPSAAQLDEARRPQPAVARPEPAAPAPQTATVQPNPGPAIAASTPPPSTSPLVQSATQEGDLVNSGDLDQAPRVLRQVNPVYPPVAQRQRIEDEVIISALVSETGKVIDTKILRGESKPFGFNEAALRAVRGFTFAPGVKDGKRVKTWYGVPFRFTLK
ncbi:MAG TPA: TonB family protein [Thermoanaerobaculia bacterium]|nr:TonB family protein [Thermoanaerobaculia bacterium]